MNTTQYKFDTISVMTNLKQSGFEEKPSVAIVDAISQAVENLVTTEELEAGLEKLKNELMQALQAMKAELLVRIDGVDVKHDKATASLGSSLIQRVDGVESKLTQKIEDVRYELLQRIEKLEFMVEALQTGTESLKAKVEQIAKEFVDLRAEMKNLTVEVNGLKKAMEDFIQDMTKNQEDFKQEMTKIMENFQRDMKKDQEGFKQEMLKMMENFKLDMEAKFARFQLMTMVTIISTGSSMAAIWWGLTKLFGGN